MEILIAIDTAEKLKGYGFMQRLEKRWDEEFPKKTYYSTKDLQNNPVDSRKKEKKAQIYNTHRK